MQFLYRNCLGYIDLSMGKNVCIVLFSFGGKNDVGGCVVFFVHVVYFWKGVVLIKIEGHVIFKKTIVLKLEDVTE